MKKFALKIAYDGSFFSGFAQQKSKHIISVSEKIKQALLSMGIKSTPIGAGRTDKGVHSLGMVITIETQDYWDCDKLHYILAPKIYPHIIVRKVWEVPSHFHPRFNAKARTYYYITSPAISSPFLTLYIANEKIGDITLFRECLKLCIGRHNFVLFKKQGSATIDDMREIYYTRLKIFYRFCKPYYVIVIRANGFLRSQIRLMLGAIFAVSRGEMTLQDFKSQLLAHKKSYSKPLKPQGLYFAKVDY